MQGLLTTLVLVPIAGAFITYPWKSRMGDRLAALIAVLTFILSAVSILWGYPGRHPFYTAQLPWLQTRTPLFGFLLDPLSSLMLIVITAIGILVVVYSAGYLSPANKDHAYKENRSGYYFWMLLFIGSMVGIAVSPGFLQLFIFWEMTTMCSWALISYHRDSRSLLNGFKALLLTHLGGTAFLIALALLFVNTGSLAFGALDSLTPGLRTAVFLLIAVAAWAKAAQIPFYTWLPDAMVAPTPVSAYLHAAAMVKAGVYLVARTAVSNTTLPHTAGLVLGIMAVITIMAAVIMYFFQDDLKRLLAFSTIGHLGYILFGVSLGIMGSATGFKGGILHIINHGFAKGLLFLSVGAIAYATGTRSIRELSGLGRKMPIVSMGFIIGLFAVTGVAPLSCFWSKFMMFTGAFEIGGTAGPIMGVAVLLESMAAFAWYLFVGHRVFFGKTSEKADAAMQAIPSTMTAPLVILIALCFLAPWIGWAFVQYLSVGVFH